MSGADMILHYQRGHEMSGYVTLTVEADGTAAASRSGRGDLGRREATGVLTPGQAERLAAAVEAADLAHLDGSTRRIGDDEVPVTVELGTGSDRRKLRLWSGDAASNPAFAAFEAAVRALVDELLES
jgi:hypothetical protein